MKVLLAGDVMLGRGIDQILPFPAPPKIYEGYCTSALDYVAFAERRNGPIPRKVAPGYIWGDMLAEMDARRPDLRIINLETAITLSEQYMPKGINYRMNPANFRCLEAAGIDCCVLANNHVLDWGPEGLEETLNTLEGARIFNAGAGRDAREAATPAALRLESGRRLLVHAVACPSSGVPGRWAARADRPGVHFLTGHVDRSARELADRIARDRGPGDIVAVSIHWGGNWGYDIGEEERELAHFFIEEAQVDFIHGHSSHHPKGVEIHHNRAILYGCGDLINDYEGISGHAAFRPDLVCAFVLGLEPDGAFAGLELLPFRLRRFRLERAGEQDRHWLAGTLDRECRKLGTGVVLDPGGRLVLVRR
jgi:poly-gamma-glutamate capsule biosynthesis protein CapA/YwtB (metallophosphatase superfamily)